MKPPTWNIAESMRPRRANGCSLGAKAAFQDRQIANAFVRVEHAADRDSRATPLASFLSCIGAGHIIKLASVAPRSASLRPQVAVWAARQPRLGRYALNFDGDARGVA
jgi:hypothetical protein